MKRPCAIFSDDNGSGADPLWDMELRIARRADEFARDRRSASLLNLQCWLLAEAEVLGFTRDFALAGIHRAELRA